MRNYEANYIKLVTRTVEIVQFSRGYSKLHLTSSSFGPLLVRTWSGKASY